MTFLDLLSVALSGVAFHNVLQVAASRLSSVATAVDQGDVKTLAADAVSAVHFVQEHDPSLVAAAEREAATLKADAEAEVTRLRHDAAEVLRRLAVDVERAATAVPVAPAEAPAPAAPEAPVVS